MTKMKQGLTAIAGMIVIALTGCSHPRPMNSQTLRFQLQQREQEISRLRTTLRSNAVTIQRCKDEMDYAALQEPGREVDGAGMAGSASIDPARLIDLEVRAPAGADEDVMLPPNARPGECYARVQIPAVYETVVEEVLVEDGSERFEIVPAEYELGYEQVLVREASQRLEIVPAEYKEEQEWVQVTPASTRVEEVPAEYEWVEEEVLIKPARAEWKKGRGPVEQVDNATGEIMCLVEVPAEYEVVRKHVLKTPATATTIEVPAEYKTMTKTVMVRPPYTRTIDIPAEYESVSVRRIVRPEEKRVIPVPPKYETVTKEQLVSGSRSGWRRVLCETNLSRDIISRIQQTLLEAGYEVGQVDGIIGRRTYRAVERYQADRDLAVGGLTIETLQQMGIGR